MVVLSGEVVEMERNGVRYSSEVELKKHTNVLIYFSGGISLIHKNSNKRQHFKIDFKLSIAIQHLFPVNTPFQDLHLIWVDYVPSQTTFFEYEVIGTEFWLHIVSHSILLIPPTQKGVERIKQAFSIRSKHRK